MSGLISLPGLHETDSNMAGKQYSERKDLSSRILRMRRRLATIIENQDLISVDQLIAQWQPFLSDNLVRKNSSTSDKVQLQIIISCFISLDTYRSLSYKEKTPHISIYLQK